MFLPATAFILVAIERKKKKYIVALLKQHNRKLYEKIEKWFRQKADLAFLRVKKTGRSRKAVLPTAENILVSRRDRVS